MFTSASETTLAVRFRKTVPILARLTICFVRILLIKISDAKIISVFKKFKETAATCAERLFEVRSAIWAIETTKNSHRKAFG